MNSLEFCALVENRLGWQPPNQSPTPYIRYGSEAGKVKRKVASNPELYTWDNLRVAVEYLVRHRLPRTPVGVFSYVEMALEIAKEREEDVELDIQAAIRVERHRGDPDGWVSRFSRAQGGYRRLALDEWRATHAR